MKTIKVTKHTRSKIREYANDESVDKALNRLFDSIEPPVQSDMDLSITNIVINESTYERLITYKLTPNESHSDTILRLLLAIEKEL